MKPIRKTNPPEILIRIYKELAEGKIELGTKPFETLVESDYRDIDTDEKIKTKNLVQRALADEQGWICCYCNQEITEKDGKILMKIEHYKPESIYTGEPWPKSKENKLCPKNRETNPLPDLRIAYSNFLCGCKGKHCDDDGSGKGDWELCMIQNPATIAEKDFQRVFEIFYSNQGYIYSKHRYGGVLDSGNSCNCSCEKERKRACLNWELGGCKDILDDFEQGILNLNTATLKGSRDGAWAGALRDIISEVLNLHPRSYKLERLDWRGEIRKKKLEAKAKSEAKKLKAKYSSKRKKDNKFFPFCMYILYRLEKEFGV